MSQVRDELLSHNAEVPLDENVDLPPHWGLLRALVRQLHDVPANIVHKPNLRGYCWHKWSYSYTTCSVALSTLVDVMCARDAWPEEDEWLREMCTECDAADCCAQVLLSYGRVAAACDMLSRMLEVRASETTRFLRVV